MRKQDRVWERIFNDYDVLNRINNEGVFRISADNIRPYYEPRLVTKFDCSKDLPKVMQKNNVAILPDTTGTYVLGKFNIFQEFPEETEQLTSVSFPDWIESIDSSNISSEAVAISAATITPIFADFVGDDELVSTVSGRMSSGQFNFVINNTNIEVNSSQIEIDGALESPSNFILLEAKKVIHDDFIIRQLFYPFKTFESKIHNKPIKSIFVIHSNDVFRLLEYSFVDPTRYDSCTFVRERRYCINNKAITRRDIEQVVKNTQINDETYGAPFIQCDSFSKIINILEMLEKNGVMTEANIVDLFGFSPRQGNYYFNGCRYIGLVSKNDKGEISLTDRAKNILHLSYRERQLKIVSFIIEHTLFNKLLKIYLSTNQIPNIDEIRRQMNNMHLCNDNKVTINRRSSTVLAWLLWIIGLIQD